MPEVKFLEVLNGLSEKFIKSLQDVAGEVLMEQIDRVIVPVQKIGGPPENFSVMIFAFPRLSSDELKNMPLPEEVSYAFNIGMINLRVDVDHFGQVNWIHIEGAPHIYERLEIALSIVAERGDYTEFWKH